MKQSQTIEKRKHQGNQEKTKTKNKSEQMKKPLSQKKLNKKQQENS